MSDPQRNPIFASVAADLGHVPGDHHALDECQPYATRPRRNSRGQFVSSKEQSA